MHRDGESRLLDRRHRYLFGPGHGRARRRRVDRSGRVRIVGARYGVVTGRIEFDQTQSLQFRHCPTHGVGHRVLGETAVGRQGPDEIVERSRLRRVGAPEFLPYQAGHGIEHMSDLPSTVEQQQVTLADRRPEVRSRPGQLDIGDGTRHRLVRRPRRTPIVHWRTLAR